jgi:hypothetical protein
MPFANATIPFSVNFPIDTTLQMVIADPTSPDGAWLTQATEIHIAVAPNPTPLPVPAGDDTFHTYSFASLPCGPASFPFYGAAHSTFSVVSNGRVMFGTPVADFNPTVASAMSQSPSINRWVDLNLDPTTGGAGSVAISIPAPGIIRVQWTAVPFYAAVGSANTFALVMDSLTGAVTIENGLSFQQVTPTPPNMFLGISPGGPAATNPGAAAFVIGGPFPGPGGGGMTYQFGAAGTLALGVSSLVFVPNASGNYAWSGF